MNYRKNIANSNRESTYFFEYIKEIVALKSNKKNFTCSFGGELASCGKENFEKCTIQSEVYFVSDQEVCSKIEAVKRTNKWKKFHYFGYEAENGVLFYERKIIRFLNICFFIQLAENRVCIYVGNTYACLVKLKISNLHPVKEIVSDILEMLLLQNGYATIYCSAAYCPQLECALLMFSAPRTGKTRTCMTLCEKYGFKYVSEDYAVTDGSKVYGAPWTDSFRDYNGNNSARQGNSKGTQWLSKQNNIDCMKATNIVILENSTENLMTKSERTENFAEKLLSLQRYAIHYYWSPTITALGYFDHNYLQDNLMKCERQRVRELCQNTENWNLMVSNGVEFVDYIAQKVQIVKK